MNETFLSWFLNVVTINFRTSRGGRLLLGGNPKDYEVAEHIATKVEVNPRMFSTLKKAKSIWSMKPRGNFDISVVGPMGIVFAFVKRKIWRGYSKSGIFYCRPYMSTFLVVSFSLVIETCPKRWRIIWERFCFKSSHTVGRKILLSIWGFTLKISILI